MRQRGVASAAIQVSRHSAARPCQAGAAHRSGGVAVAANQQSRHPGSAPVNVRLDNTLLNCSPFDANG